MTEAEQRAAVLTEARKWIRTPYHNCADIKGVGVDCGMLLVRVFVDTKMVPFFDPRPYPPDWHLHRGEEKYLGFVFDRAHAVESPQAGDVAVFRFGRCYSHGGIVTRSDPLTIVHAYFQARCVIEETVARNSVLSDPARKPRFFSHWMTNERTEEPVRGQSAVLDDHVFGSAGSDLDQHAANPDRVGGGASRA